MSWLPNPCDLDNGLFLPSDVVWNSRDHDFPFGAFPQDEVTWIQDSRVRHAITRRSGTCLWKRHKCIRCGEPVSQLIGWIRYYFPDSGIFDARLHEQCIPCGRTTSWPYLGVAPKEWRHQPHIARRRDTQKQKSYKWQWSWVYGHPYLATQLSPEACEEFTGYVCREVGVSPPKVVILPFKKGLASSSTGTSKISLVETWGLCRWVILHELGHTFQTHLQAAKLVPKNEAHHGPYWVSLYCLLLERYGEVNFNVFDKAREGGIRLYTRASISDLLNRLRG